MEKKGAAQHPKERNSRWEKEVDRGEDVENEVMGGLWVPLQVWFKTGFMVEKIQSLGESSKPLGDCPRSWRKGAGAGELRDAGC